MLQFLKNDQDFAAFRVSKSFQNKFLKIRVRYAQNQNTPRFGFIIPKKVMPKVVDRNKVRRRLKAFLSQKSGMVRSADVIFYPYKDLVRVEFSELSKQTEDLFTKAKLWK